MRVLVLSYGRRVGGVQSHVDLLLRKLAQKGILRRAFLPDPRGLLALGERELKEMWGD